MTDYQGMSVKELRAEAKAVGVVGYSRMSKGDLLVLLEGVEAVVEVEVAPAPEVESVSVTHACDGPDCEIPGCGRTYTEIA